MQFKIENATMTLWGYDYSMPSLPVIGLSTSKISRSCCSFPRNYHYFRKMKGACVAFGLLNLGQ